jgi:hypothetical protein
VVVNAIPNASVNDTVTIDLRCTQCNFAVEYSLDDTIKSNGYRTLEFSRTLSLPQKPALLDYQVHIPLGHIIEDDTGSADPSIVPAATEISTDGQEIIVSWVEESPELPKRYFVRYSDFETVATPAQEFKREFGEWTVWVIGLTLLVVGFGIGWLVKRTPVNRVRYIPDSLFTPDEQKVVDLLKKNKEMHQKEVVKELDWSKSKVSAVVTNLEYKKVLTRQKFGRNYKVRLAERIAEAPKGPV